MTAVSLNSPRLDVALHIDDLLALSPTPALSTCQTIASPTRTLPRSGAASPSLPIAFKLESLDQECLSTFDTELHIFGDSEAHQDSLFSDPVLENTATLADIQFPFPTPNTSERGRSHISPTSSGRWQREDSQGRGRGDSTFPRSGLGFDPSFYPQHPIPYGDSEMLLDPSTIRPNQSSSQYLPGPQYFPNPSAASPQYDHLYQSNFRGGSHYSPPISNVRAPRSLPSTSLPGSPTRGMTAANPQHYSHPESIQQALVTPSHSHGYPAFQSPPTRQPPAAVTDLLTHDRPSKRIRSATEHEHVTRFPAPQPQYSIPTEVIIPAASDETPAEAAQRRGKGRERPKAKGSSSGIKVSSRRSKTASRDITTSGSNIYSPTHRGAFTTEPSSYDAMSHPHQSTFVQFQGTVSTNYAYRDEEMRGNTVDLHSEEPFEHPPTDLPPRMYSGGVAAPSPWKPQKPVGKIPGSALDYLPILEARFDRLERAVDGYVEYRSQQAIANSKIHGVSYNTPLPATLPDKISAPRRP